jgi:hypothetical protein
VKPWWGLVGSNFNSFRDGNMAQRRKSAVWCIGRITYWLGCESETLMTLREYYRPLRLEYRGYNRVFINTI